MAKSGGTNEPKFSGTGSRAGVLGPKTKIANTSKGTATGLQKGKAKGGAKLAPSAGPNGRATDIGGNKMATKGKSLKKDNTR